MIRHSFHNHTVLCKHADGSVADYVQAAVQSGLVSIGMSDHIPFPDGRWDHTRMDLDQLGEYVQEVTRAKSRYPEIDVFIGGECEWVPQFSDHYAMLKHQYGFEYLIGAPHWIPMDDATWVGYTHLKTAAQLRSFAAYVQESIETGHFLYFAHPDVFLAGYTRWDENTRACARDIIRTAAAENVPLELNANGFRKKKIIDGHGNLRAQYPVRQFWELAAEENISVIVGADAHTPGHVADSTETCYAWIEELGLRDVQGELYRSLKDAADSSNDGNGRTDEDGTKAFHRISDEDGEVLDHREGSTKRPKKPAPVIR